jgi:D-alanyl-D-alanine carboxypeptidase (penicillin-binding protein 5/6)
MVNPKLGHFWLLFIYPVLGFFALEGIILKVWENSLAHKAMRQVGDIISPLPPLQKSRAVLAADLWLPNEGEVLEGLIEKPEIKAESYIAIDLSTNQILLEKESRKRQPVASLVKIMTALVALEKRDLNQVITISEQAASIGEATMGLSPGEKLTLEELLWGLLLVSGNDAAEAMATGLVPRGEIFVRWMNSKALELGLLDTYFINSTGLEEKGKTQYSTAYDVMVVSYHALKDPVFCEIVATKEYFIPYSQDHKAFYLPSQTNLLGQYPGVAGVKVGYTDEAGLCGVTLAENGGHEILGVVLNSFDRREDLRNLLDYSFEILGVKISF